MKQTITAIDTQKLSWQIKQLTSLKSSIESMSWVKDDVGECGGSAISNIEDTQNVLIEMKDSYYKLLNNTISYLNERKLSIQTKDANAVKELY